MLLAVLDGRLDVRSTEETSIDGLYRLRAVLENSEVISSLVHERRPRRGGRAFSIVSLLLI